MKKIDIISDPIGFIKFWFELHMVCARCCGDWFGVVLYPNGTIKVRNKEFGDFLKSCIKK